MQNAWCFFHAHFARMRAAWAPSQRAVRTLPKTAGGRKTALPNRGFTPRKEFPLAPPRPLPPRPTPTSWCLKAKRVLSHKGVPSNAAQTKKATLPHYCGKVAFLKRKSRHLPIFAGRLQPTIFGTTELNFCVRNGNRWNLCVIGTGQICFKPGLHIFSFA